MKCYLIPFVSFDSIRFIRFRSFHSIPFVSFDSFDSIRFTRFRSFHLIRNAFTHRSQQPPRSQQPHASLSFPTPAIATTIATTATATPPPPSAPLQPTDVVASAPSSCYVGYTHTHTQHAHSTHTARTQLARSTHKQHTHTAHTYNTPPHPTQFLGACLCMRWLQLGDPSPSPSSLSSLASLAARSEASGASATHHLALARSLIAIRGQQPGEPHRPRP